MQEQPLQQAQEPVQKPLKKKDNPLGLILVICISILAMAMFPIGFVKYSDGATRIITPAATMIFNKTNDYVWSNDEITVTKPEIDIFLIPNNFKTYEELLEIKEQREAKKP